LEEYGMTSSTWVDLLVAVKPLTAAKSRLRPAGPADSHRDAAHALVLAMLSDALTGELASPAVRRAVGGDTRPAGGRRRGVLRRRGAVR